jgi:hypothetical protein
MKTDVESLQCLYEEITQAPAQQAPVQQAPTRPPFVSVEAVKALPSGDFAAYSAWVGQVLGYLKTPQGKADSQFIGKLMDTANRKAFENTAGYEPQGSTAGPVSDTSLPQ